MAWTSPPCACGETVNQIQDSVVVVGQGYVGLPLAMRAVEVGYRVVGYDTDINRIKLLKRQSYSRASFDLLRRRVLMAA